MGYSVSEDRILELTLIIVNEVYQKKYALLSNRTFWISTVFRSGISVPEM